MANLGGGKVTIMKFFADSSYKHNNKAVDTAFSPFDFYCFTHVLNQCECGQCHNLPSWKTILLWWGGGVL